MPRKLTNIDVDARLIGRNIKLIWIDGRKYTNSKLEKYMVENIISQFDDISKGDIIDG